jgi:hypothetical protein
MARPSLPAAAGPLRVAALWLLFAPIPLVGQQWWAFETRRIADPLLADVRGAQISVLFPAFSDAFEFSPVEDRFFGWDISLGAEIPLAGWESESSALGDLTEGEGAVGLWLPISFHMIEDVQHDELSRPILNTDYRFAILAKGAYRAWSATAVEARVSLGHESTHIGDEFALQALEHAPNEFRRVNVSYESLDYGIGLQHLRAFPLVGQSEVLVRHVGTLLVSPGFYSPELLEGPAGMVTAPKRKYEPGFAAQLLPESPWRPGISIEARRRVVFGYDRPNAADPEETRWSWNVIIATRTQEIDFAAKIHFLLYARFYNGVNPAGQFRNDPSYRIWGIGILSRIGAR